MKKYILLLFALILSFPLLAQLEVKEGSFKEVPGFVNINTEKMYDDNDKPYAVLKIKTENISSKERHELNFKGDAQTFFEVEYKDGEVWLYISYYATYIKISHEEFSSTEFHFPFDMNPKCGYELTLVNKASNNGPGSGSLIITTTPEDGATISLNGKILNQTTPYSNDMIAAGQYEITVSKHGFESVTKTIVIDDGATAQVDIKMPYLYGNIRIESNPTGATVYIDNIIYGKTPLIINNIIYGEHELKIKKDNYTIYKKHFVVNNQEFIDFSATLQRYPTGAISGIFSVSENKKVYFSKGNLQYQPSTKTWRFAEHQWDFIKTNNYNLTNNDWIDKFYWGSSGYNNQEPDKYKQKMDLSCGNADITGTNYDWGINNDISNGASQKWHTLSYYEWGYVFFYRKTNSGIRFAKAQVNGVNGIILVPDNWKESTYSINEVNKGRAHYSDNIINKNTWIDLFESNGAVFLPAAGTTNQHIGTRGFYWSTTKDPPNGAKHVYFSSDSFELSGLLNKYSHISVRLVTDDF